MQYKFTTDRYNDSRYGKPWLSICSTSLSRNFEFMDWEGKPGHAGLFLFEAEPGDLLAYGQKDHRKNRGGVDSYWLCLSNGSTVCITGEEAKLWPMKKSERLAKLEPKPVEQSQIDMKDFF